MRLNFNKEHEFVLTTEKRYEPAAFKYANVAIALGGNTEAQLLPKKAFITSDRMEAEEFLEDGDKTSISYILPERQVRASAEILSYQEIDIIKQVNTITNYGNETHTLTRCATQVNGICADEEHGIKDRLSDGSIIIHYCFNKTQGEGQWRSATPEDIGLYFTSHHINANVYARLDSICSFSTGVYFPLVLIEDRKENECWYCEIEGGQSWFLEFALYGGTKATSLSVRMGSADERLGFSKKLKAGENYTSCGCIYGVTKGGFEEGIRQLIKYKRATSLVKNEVPFIFNDYMNCNWAIENNQRLLGLIDRASELGCEVFCIDDGWQVKQGLWYPANEKYENLGLQGILDYIKSKGMIPGVWFEFEMAPLELAETLGEDIFLRRNGEIVATWRPLGNLRSSAYVNYLYERVDELYQMGVRYIKNDHNNGEALGTDLYGESPAEGCENNALKLMDFIDSLGQKYPDLIIENCGGGANRSDWGTLKHFSIQSTSDQENYRYYPSIIGGSLAQMPPERAGIWCYPYPLSFFVREQDTLSEERKKECADGEETMFNVVNGMMGAMYLSGRIDHMDEYNFALLKEGTSLYLKERDFIRQAFPIFPKGMIRMSNCTEYALGLINEECTRAILAVWNLSDDKRAVQVNLKKYNFQNCKSIYSEIKETADYEYEEGTLKCSFYQGRSARLFCLTR